MDLIPERDLSPLSLLTTCSQEAAPRKKRAPVKARPQTPTAKATRKADKKPLQTNYPEGYRQENHKRKRQAKKAAKRAGTKKRRPGRLGEESSEGSRRGTAASQPERREDFRKGCSKRKILPQRGEIRSRGFTLIGCAMHHRGGGLSYLFAFLLSQAAHSQFWSGQNGSYTKTPSAEKI